MKPTIFLAAIIVCNVSAAESIPLKDVWAWQMPGTYALAADRDVKDKFVSDEGILIEEIVRCLPLARSGHMMPDGFAVAGSGAEALQGAYATLVEKQRPMPLYRTDSEVSVVFFTDLSAYRAQIKEVVRDGENVEIKYDLAPAELGANFAIIPLGKLANGRYRVRMTPPADQKHIADRIVCKPFSFVVKTMEPYRTIPIKEIWGYHIPGTRELANDQTDGIPQLVADIRTALQKLPRPTENQQGKRGFLVPGTGIDALREARDVLVGDKKQRITYSEGDEASLMFFTYPIGTGIELVSVQ